MNTARLIDAMAFIFTANDEKGFKKLSENQFSRQDQGIIMEPIANALDQSPPDRPLEIALRLEDNSCLLSFRDHGEGLHRTNLAALHFIGSSSKRSGGAHGWEQVAGESIGRFGMGLVGAFHQDNHLRQVEIVTQVCGRPARILYDCTGVGIPTWRLEPTDTPCAGFTITFHLPHYRYHTMHQGLQRFLDRTVVPVIYNGNLRHRDPATLPVRSPDDILVTRTGCPTIHYALHLEHAGFTPVDRLWIYLKGMPISEGSLYSLFMSAGDKMPQNQMGFPYWDNESVVVLSRSATPTLSRDALVDDAALAAIKSAIRQARAQALVELLRKARSQERDGPLRRQAMDAVMVNVYSLRYPLGRHLAGVPLTGEETHYAELLDALLDYPAFTHHDAPMPISIREIWQRRPAHGVLFVASRESRDAYAGMLMNTLVFHETPSNLYRLFGGHAVQAVEDILCPMLGCIPNSGLEVVNLDLLDTREEKAQELERKGVLVPKHIHYHLAGDDAEPGMERFLSALKELLNRSWFRRAIARLHPPSRIHLHNIVVDEKDGDTSLVASVLSGLSTPSDIHIGIRGKSPIIRGLIDDPQGPMAFLPILCHEMSHRRVIASEADGHNHHGHSFHLYRHRLETRVLTGAVAHLLGLDETDAANDALDWDGGVMVL